VSTKMVPRFLKPDFLKKILFAFLICFGIGFPIQIFAPGLTTEQQATAEANRKAVAALKEADACMGSLIFYEARGEPLEGQRGVLDVTLNRAEASGLSVCDVLRQPGQYQWVKHHDPKVVDTEKLALLHSVPRTRKLAKSYKWFYSLPSPPKWAHNMTCRLIGHTTFCASKEKK